jgi:hypothetical protein
MGQTVFVDPFIEQTGLVDVIGPRKEVPFNDACVFRINYFYLVSQEGLTPKNVFRNTRPVLKKELRVNLSIGKVLSETRVSWVNEYA